MKSLNVLYKNIPCATINWDNSAKIYEIIPSNIVLFLEKDRALLQLALNDINAWVKSGNLPWWNEFLEAGNLSKVTIHPWQDEWWDHARTLLNHNTRLGPTREITQELDIA